MRDRILVFAHMMKTAGTSLSKELIGHFGPRMHIVPGGLRMDHDYYDAAGLERDFNKLNGKLSLISGHPMRPYIDFGQKEDSMDWFTFFREPHKRYLSHFLHDYEWTRAFSIKRYRHMREKTIVEWEKIEHYGNYQTKFIAGEANLNKAIDILEQKIKWVGLTEDYDRALCSFRRHFELQDFRYDIQSSNTARVDAEQKQELFETYRDHIHETNRIDQELYDYVKRNIAPRYATDQLDDCSEMSGGSKLLKTLNILRFQINRQRKFKTEEIKIKNIRRYLKRWF